MKRNNIFRSLTLALLLSAVLCLPARAFSKEPASWSAQQIKHLEDVGLLDWDLYTKSTDPTSAIKRGDFCQMLVNLVQMEGDWEKIGKVDPVPDGYFADESSVDGAYAMYYGAAYGITEGSSKDGKRVADERSNLTREQAAKMMCALIDALETYGGVPAPQEKGAKTFTDQSAIASWAAEHVARASSMGILQGDDTGRFNPKGTLTWQEACVMVDRVYTTAEQAVKARRAEQGIALMDTGLDLSADKYLREGAKNLYALENGGKRSVLFLDNSTNKGVRVETYNADGSSAGIRNIPMELDTCGGFYEGSDAYYLAFGQSNMEESSSKSVFRVVKYDKNWNRLGAADISNCYTTGPFHASAHNSMAEQNGVLVLHTARQRYLTRDDNLRHQSNFTAKIRTSDMTVLSQSETFPGNYVSHSFAQYVAFDGSTPVYVDHGDAYPRGFALSVENSRGSVRQQTFFSFSGATGDNTTNAVPGGLGISGSNYLFAGASSPQTGGDSLKKANAFLSVIPKSGGQAQTKWLTSLSGGSSGYVNDVRLVQVNNNTFVIMWQVTRPGNHFYKFGELQYAVFDGQGNQTGQTKSMPGYIMPAASVDPSVYGSRIVWAKPELDVSDRYTNRDSRYVQIFELDISANSATAQNPGTSGGTSTQPGGSTTTKPGTGTTKPGGSTGSAGSAGTPSASYPTTKCTVNDIVITRTDVGDKETTPYYREDWDGNWLEVSVKGNTFTLSGCSQEAGNTRAVLAVTSPAANGFISKGEPFTLTSTVNASDLAGGKNISVGVAGDTDYAYTSFRSGVTLKAVQDSSGNPTIQVILPFWLKDGSSASSGGSTSSGGGTDTNTGNTGSIPSTAAKLKYMPETLTIKVGETKNLFAYLYGTSGTCNFTSSDPSVATVDQTDLTGVAPGTTTLTATVRLGGTVTAYGQCRVTVIADSSSATAPPSSSGQSGEVEYVKGVVCTKLPADGVVTSYREEYNGAWLQLDVSGSTITFSGCGQMSNSYYNYAVLRAFRVQNETAYRAGVAFQVSVTVDAQALAAFYESEGGPSIITSLVAQNYKPGDSNMGGYGFQSGATIAVVPSGSGVALKVTR